MHCQLIAELILIFSVCLSEGTPKSSENWQLLAQQGAKFSPRNGRIWVTGGRTDLYTMYNLLDSYKVADVWSSPDGAVWTQEEKLTGDFYAQNIDVVQPGSIAPWYQRYGHSLDPYDIDGDGTDDVMIQMGGYASSPSNDIWVTEDGNEWLYAGLAPWSPRAWHSTVRFNGTLYMMGGTPLNNEVWRLDNVTTKWDRPIPLTRSMYANHTYTLKWTQMPDAPWSPRVGAGVVSQWYFNTAEGQFKNTSSRERMVLAGGYGGWLESSAGEQDYRGKYDGFYCRADTWESYDGMNWTMLNHKNSFKGRAWFGMSVQYGETPQDDLFNTQEPPKMYIFGGGYIGFSTDSIKIVSDMQGKADGYWSRDGIEWTKINYEEGGGKTTVPFYSSQEWAKTIVDTNTKYLGLWGLTVETNYNSSAREMYLIGGDFTGNGEFTSDTYRSLDGIYCDVLGSACSGVGVCGTGGCLCPYATFGDRCQYGRVMRPPSAGASGFGMYNNWKLRMFVLSSAMLFMLL